jgi:two-component system sensor histidine kinase CreC
MSLRRRLILLMATILLLGGLMVGEDLLDSFRKGNSEIAEAMMYEFARALAAQVETAGGAEKAKSQLAALFAAYQEKRGDSGPVGALQAYVTDAKGVVVFSSRDPSEVGRDYSRWNDVYLALRDKYAARATHRIPQDPNTSDFYVAAPIQIDGKIAGVVSVIKGEDSVRPFIDRAVRRAIPVIAFALVLVGLFSILLMIWLTLPLHRLRDYALAVSEGKSTNPPQMGPRELAELVSAFEKMRITLEGKKAVEDFVQGLVHELKSPLTTIQGAAELGLEKVSDEERENFLKSILREGSRLQSLLEELLRLAKLEGLIKPDRREKVDLLQLAQDACEAMESPAKQRNLRISCEGKAAGAYGDPILLEQAIRNLVGNALQFSPSGCTIRVSVSEANGGAELKVSDEGPGVPTYAMEKIFDKFYSLERPDGSPRSSGLGLSFVRQVLQLHGGNVALLPSPKGALFRIWLPAA